MKRWVGNLLLVVVSLVIALGIGEFALRQLVRPPPKFETIIQTILNRSERLFPANTTVRYDIAGLYEGAKTVDLKVSNNRFIEPEPRGAHKFRVLFLGGSTTEAIYVGGPQRWVALLNEPGYLAAYNAAQSGANTIDEYLTFDYLTKQGMKFDLVVLATGQNDTGWQGIFERYGRRFVVEEYKSGLQDYLNELHPEAAKQASQPAPQSRPTSAVLAVAAQALRRLREFLLSRTIATPVVSNVAQSSAIQSGTGSSHVTASVNVAEAGSESNTETNTVTVSNNVTETYRQMRQAALKGFFDVRGPAHRSLMERYPNLESFTQKYRADTAHNLRLLHQSVTSTGAKLLVITEATSWLAPSSSFHEDLRIPSGMRSYQDLHDYRQLLNGIYLEAAKEAGALTYDLAADVNPHSNGPEGGKYIYDMTHYTPEGCQLVARIMRPVLRRVLENGRAD